MNLPSEVASNIQIKTYLAGHMPYLDKATRKEMISDLRAFYRDSLGDWGLVNTSENA